MTEDQMIEDQEVDLHDDNDVVEEAHDPKNAEAQSIASVDKAENAGKTAPKRKGDNTKQDPMPKAPSTKAGMINAAYMKMAGMKKEDLANMYGKIMAEDVDVSDDAVVGTPAEIDYNADFSQDLNALVAEEATLSEEFKEKAEIIFEAAIKSKLAEEIDRLEEKYNEELAEEVESTKAELVEKVDSYLNYVVENWMDENKVAIQNGLRTEIAEKFMNSLKDLFTESYIEVPESKVDIVDELAETVDELEGQLNASIASGIEMQEKLEVLQRDAIIREHSTDLAETQIEKLKSLVEDVDFDDWDSFSTKVLTVKESYFTKKVSESADIVEEDDDGTTPIHTSPAMEQYLSAIKKTQK
jgi:gas vesicle protein